MPAAKKYTGAGWRRDLERQRIRKEAIDANPPVCNYCAHFIPKPRRYTANVRYCNERCKKEYQRERARDKNRILDAVDRKDPAYDPEAVANKLYGPKQTRSGPEYERVVAALTPGEIEAWIDRKLTNNDIARRAGLTSTPQALGRIRNQLWNERLLKVESGTWEPLEKFQKMLGPPDRKMLDWAHSDDETQRAKFETALDDLVKAFVLWRNTFFTVGFERAYMTEPFHRDWIRATLKAIYLGQRLMILSPPRHGKTDLLIHFSVWLILRNPDVKILWIGPNEEIAKNSLGMVKDLLETHEPLRDAFLPPGKFFRPQKRTEGTWSSDKFTVASRRVPQKQPTMWATGVGGKILSLDADFIIVDDPADPDDSYTQGGRDKVDNWFKVKLASRKMDHTGLVMISSRVHPDDLYNQFIDHRQWTTIVNKAHDQTQCGLDLYTDHPDTSCVLFPALNPLSYLQEQADVIGMPLFEMMYLNQPRPNTALIFDPDVIRTLCVDHSRALGTASIPGRFRLVAGLDPAAAGTQAAFLWAISEVRDPQNASKTMFLYNMVDTQTQQAGGVEGALSVMEEWHTKYGADLWVVEDNAYQSVFFRDPRVRTLTSNLGITLKPTHTDHRKKFDPKFGLSGLAAIFHEGRVILPYATPEARRKTDQLITSLTKFTGDDGPARKGSDLLMAAWFPFATIIRRWVQESKPSNRAWQDPIRSYPSYDQTTYDAPPWGASDYPY